MKLSKMQLIDARDWLLDCCRDEDEAEFIKELSDEEIERLVSKYFENGIEGFLASYN